MSLQLTAFYKETEDLIQVLNINTDVTNIAFTNNGDFGVVKGFDVIFNLRRTKNLSATANYEFQTARGTGSATGSNFDIAWLGGARGNFPKFIQPLNYEQRHTATINLDYRFANDEAGIFENSGMNILFSYNSGRPFTMTEVRNTLPFTGRYDNDISNTPISAINSALTPMNYRMDLKVNKIFTLPYVKAKLNVYAWVINLLNSETVVAVWNTTGLPDQTGYLKTTPGTAYYNGLTAEERQNYGMREMDYLNYGVPRQIRLGASLEF